MKAIGYQYLKPISEENSLEDIDIPIPTPSDKDILVKIDAIAVNPVDFKIRQNVEPEPGSHRILGWDAVGEVVSIGTDVTLFSPGDKIFYAGDLTRQGCNAEYQLVDERIVAHKPKSLSDGEAAAMPLTSITAYELLFDRLNIPKASSEKRLSNDIILVVGASGGVGSILIQLIKNLTNATVIATASRSSSQSWVEHLGADYVIDHSQDLVLQVKSLGFDAVTHIASLTHTETYLDAYVELLKPMGKLALIDDPQQLDVKKLKSKCLSLHWEFMFSRSMYQTTDMIEQHNLLTEIAELIDKGIIKTTMGKQLSKISAKNLREAHALLESGKSIGKIVLEGF